MSPAPSDRSMTTSEVAIGSVEVGPTTDGACPTWDSREGSVTTSFESPLRDTSNLWETTDELPSVSLMSRRPTIESNSADSLRVFSSWKT